MAKKFIIVRVLGGLGNQLFIYAFARYLSLKLDRSVFLETRTGFLRDTYKREYRLNRFNIKLKTCTWYSSLYYPLRKRYQKISELIFGNVTFMNEAEFIANPELALIKIQKSEKNYIDGYWQYSNYLNDYENTIREELSVRNEINNRNIVMANVIKRCNSVAIHVRRVRYDTLLDLNYYIYAINKIKTQIKDPVFFVFSDNIKWCQQNLKVDNSFVFVDHNAGDEVAELWLMSQCKHFIIANSTFSWWGAWLSKNTEKIVMVPDGMNINI